MPKKVVQYIISDKRPGRKALWERWKNECRIEMDTKAIDKAIELALRFLEIEKKAKPVYLIDSNLINGGDEDAK